MEALYAYASAHHGVVSRAEAYGLGATKNQVDYLLRKGILRRHVASAFVMAGSPDSWHRRARLAAVSTGGVLSHRAAAALHKIDGFSFREVEVTVAKERRPKSCAERIHRSTQFGLVDPVEIDALPVTGLARTVIDLAGCLSYARFDRVIDAVLRQSLCDWPDLYQVLVLHSVQGRNGCGPLRTILDTRYGDENIPDSLFNRMVGQLLERSGLAEPAFEHEIVDGNGRFIGRVDLAYPDLRLAIELDSVRWHLNRESFEKDPRRKNKMTLHGWTVLTFTWSDYVDRPGELVRSVATALRAEA